MQTLIKKLTLLCIFIYCTQMIQAQSVGINDDASNPDPSAILDVKSNSKGLLIPRLTTSQRTNITSPATGLMVFDSDLESFWFFNGSNWLELAIGVPPTLSDADQNTQIQMEESNNEDVMRFDIAGQEVLRIQKNANDEAIIDWISTDKGIFLGENAGLTNTGLGNVYIGENAGRANTVGQLNVIIGHGSGTNLEGRSNNTYVGSFVGSSTTTGTNNTFIGSGAGALTTTGNSNTFIGLSTAQVNTTGGNNTMLGRGAGLFNYAGMNNVFIGMEAGQGSNVDTNDFSNNTYVGYQAGRNATGNDNVFLGYNAGRTETGSNKLYIENTNANTPLIYGEFDTNQLEFNGDVDVKGAFNNTSDARLKRNITKISKPLEKIIQLNGYNYFWKEGVSQNQNLQTGLIAQEVQKVLPELVNQDRDQNLSVNYIALIPYLIESLKIQKNTMDRLIDERIQDQKQIQSLKAENRQMKQDIQSIKALLHAQGIQTN